jgi:Zn-finger nucleic acid-binding protein
MSEARAEATTGYLIVLDQCPRCGGIWCDRWELYPVTAEAAVRLDAVDKEALWHPTAAATVPLECPRCRACMRRFRDPVLPPDAHIERCPNCDGMWLNRGELRRFKCGDAAPIPAVEAVGDSTVTDGTVGDTASADEARGHGGGVTDATVTDAEVDRLARQACRDPQSWPTVSTLSDAFEAAPAAAGAEDARQEIAVGVIWLVARAALRLLLHV